MLGDQLKAATSAAVPTPPLGLPRATWAGDIGTSQLPPARAQAQH